MDISRGILVYIVVACIVTTSVIFPANAGCITTEFFLTSGRPTQSVSVSNKTCERWDDVPSLTTELDFQNESLSEAENHCRAFDGTIFKCFVIPDEERKDCYEDTSATYMGTTFTTTSGHFCQQWSQNSPNSHNFGDDDFPDKTTADAGNYCRDPDSLGTPWCFTISKDIRWQECDIGKCKPLHEKVRLEDCGIDFCPTVSSGCPRGFWRSADGNICYSVGGSRATWQEANDNCARFGAKQIELLDRSMYFFLLNVFIRGEKDIFWLGLNDRDNEGQFVWHMSGKSPSFTDWYQKEPDNLFNSEHCVSLFNARDEYKWRDDNCDRSYNYICEIDATDVQITESITTKQQEVITTSSVTMFKMETSTMEISEGDRCVITLTAVIAVMILHFSFLIMF